MERILEDSSSSQEAATRICIALELKLRLKKHGWFDGDTDLEGPMIAAIEEEHRAFAAQGALLSAEDRALMLRIHEFVRWWNITPHKCLPSSGGSAIQGIGRGSPMPWKGRSS